MKVIIIVAVLLVCAWAQYDINLCTKTDCPDNERCSDAGYPIYAYPSDRSGYTCNEEMKCVAPQCSSSIAPGMPPNAWASDDCPTDEYCMDFQCVTPPPQPEMPPESEPNRPQPIIEFNGLLSAGEPGDYCELDYHCMGGYCDIANNKCMAKKGFAQSCPATCTSSSECYEGICVSGKCVRSEYKKEVGSPCTGNAECYSNSCVDGKCAGTDCKNFVCNNAGYWCDYQYDPNGGKYVPVCNPDWNSFTSSCPQDENYAVRMDSQKVDCVPKKTPGQTCSSNYECTYFCSGNKCTSYPKNAVPEGKGCIGQNVYCEKGLVCSPFTSVCITLGEEGDNCVNPGDCISGLFCSNGKCAKPGKEGASCLADLQCESGLICNASLKCAPKGLEGATCFSTSNCATGLICNGATLKCSQLGKEGDGCLTINECSTGLICNSATKKCSELGEMGDRCSISAECSEGLACFINNTDFTSSCQQSPTIGKFCSWNAQGLHNCTYELSYHELCVCYDGGPKCVDTASEEYQAKIDPYVTKPPVIPEPEPEPDMQKIYEEVQIKMQACLGSIYSNADFLDISPDLSSSYFKHIFGCKNSGSWWADDQCKNLYAKVLCCNMCYVDVATYIRKDISSNTKFYSDLFGPITKLTCGDNPTIEFNPDTCDGPVFNTWEEIESKYSCAAKTYTYGKITFTVTIDENTNSQQAQATLKLLIEKQIAQEGLPSPASVTVTTDEEGNLVVTIVYVGAEGSGDNISQVKETLESDDFKESVSNSIQGAEVSDVETETASSGTRHILSMIALIGFALIGLLF